ncbi:hypothetical protein EBB07_24685 [Paenibacillaceae bacterium]|nr:hypothetical protein EBB07_24685 [Paenibacillaceae bacterium]
MKDALNYLTQLSLDTGTKISRKHAAIDNKSSSSRLAKTTGRLLGFIGAALTINDFWETTNYNAKIDNIINYHFINLGISSGNYMRGSTKGQLLAKYLYASERIKELLKEEKVTYISSSTRVLNANYFDPKELKRLKEELILIK